MEDLIKKISSYNLFNYLFPGIVFVVLANTITPYNFAQDDILLAIFIYYFVGLSVSRFGSLVIEPLLKKTSFVKFVEYKKYLLAIKKDKDIEILSEINNVYRTISSVFILLVILKIYSLLESKFLFLHEFGVYVLGILLLIMFLYSYKKQTKYIKDRVLHTLEKEEN